MEEKDLKKFVDSHIKIVKEFIDGENHLKDILEKKISKTKQTFYILNKEWIEKWKKIINYEEIQKIWYEFKNKKDPNIDKKIGNILNDNKIKKDFDNLEEMHLSKFQNLADKNLPRVKFENAKNIFLILNSYSSYIVNILKDRKKIDSNLLQINGQKRALNEFKNLLNHIDDKHI